MQSIKQFLNPDGTLNLPPGFSGSLDPEGLQMRTGSDGSIQFADSLDNSNWDNRFGVQGTNSWTFTVTNAPNGDIYIGGNFTYCDTIPCNYIARWSHTGSGWSPLGEGLAAAPTTIAVDPNNGDVYVGGLFANAGGDTLADNFAKWSESSGWTHIGNGLNNQVYAITISDSNIYVGGAFTDAGGNPDADRIAIWSTSSQTWSALGTGLNSIAQAIIVSDSIVYVGGSFFNAGGDPNADCIAKWNGISWSALGSGFNNYVSAIVLYKDTLYAGGYFTKSGGDSISGIARWNGTNWSKVGTGLNSRVTSLEVYENELYAGGYFTDAGGDLAADNIARWDGTTWKIVGGSLDSYVTGLHASGGSLYAVGVFQNSGNIPSLNNIARWDGTIWNKVSNVTTWGLNASVSAMTVYNNTLYVGGNFKNAGGIDDADYIAKWSSSGGWSAVAGGINGVVSTIAVNDSELVIGGVFQNVDGDANKSRIVRLSSGVWTALGSGLGDQVTSIAFFNGDIYAGGYFSNAGGDANADHIAKWSSSSGWSTVGNGLNNGTFGYVTKMIVKGDEIYVGGYFTNAGGNDSADNIAKWSPSGGWSSLGAGLNSAVYDFAFSGDELYAGGAFTNAGGDVNGKYVAKWTPPDSSSQGGWSALGDGFAHTVNAIDVRDSVVYAGSSFYNDGTKNMEQYTPSGGWQSLGSVIRNDVYKLKLFGSYLYVGGNIGSVGGKPSYYFGRWYTELPNYSLTINASHGTVEKNPSMASYSQGSSVTLTAIPDSGFHFVNWTGDISDSTNPVTIIVNSNLNITANFEINPAYTVTVNALNGTVAKTPEQDSYNPGDTITLNATPNNGYHFVNWTGDISDSINPVLIVIDSNMTITANFAIDSFSVATLALHGTITKNPNQSLYAYGTQVTLIATANANYLFTGWSGDVPANATSNPLTLTVTGNDTVKATFTADEEVVYEYDFDDGTVQSLGTEGGANVTPAGSPTHGGSGSVHFSGGGIEMLPIRSNPYLPAMVLPNITNPGIVSFWVLADTAGDIIVCWNDTPLDTVFSEDTTWVQFVIPFNQQGTGDIKFKYLSSTTAYYFDDILIFDNNALPTYTLSVTSEHGTVTQNPDRASYSEGTVVELTPVPDSGYVFKEWSGDVPAGHEMDSILSVVMDSNITITATFQSQDSVLDVREKELPKEFALLQNYPNPFNPTTTIGFQIAKTGFVQLRIYDILGRTVATLVNENLSPGTYSKVWNASNLPSGVYIYELNAGTFKAVKRLMLSK